MSSICSRSAALRAGARQLAEAGFPSPRLEARLLLAHVLGSTQEAMLRDPEVTLDPVPFLAAVERRARGEPLARILGRREFWSLDLAVGPATLIPRPESETLIEAALALFADRSQVRRVLDLGTGTGCLLLAALSEFPDAFGVGVDVVEDATRLAAENARRIGLAERAAFLVADWAAPLTGRFDLVLSNPPYIPGADIDRALESKPGESNRALLNPRSPASNPHRARRRPRRARRLPAHHRAGCGAALGGRRSDC